VKIHRGSQKCATFVFIITKCLGSEVSDSQFSARLRHIASSAAVAAVGAEAPRTSDMQPQVGTCSPFLGHGGSSDLHRIEEFYAANLINVLYCLKCVCQLQLVYLYLTSGGFALRPHRDSVCGHRWKTYVPQTPCAHPTRYF